LTVIYVSLLSIKSVFVTIDARCKHEDLHESLINFALHPEFVRHIIKYSY